jgi:hypothetical protein
MGSGYVDVKNRFKTIFKTDSSNDMGLKAEVAGRRRRLKAFSAGRGFE